MSDAGGRKRIETVIKRRAGRISRACLIGGRVLLLLTSLLILVMPWTEYFWHFDRFMRGGQDFELGMLAVATIFCLVLLLLEQGKRCWAVLMALRKLIQSAITPNTLSTSSKGWAIAGRLNCYLGYGHALQGFSLPLRT